MSTQTAYCRRLDEKKQKKVLDVLPPQFKNHEFTRTANSVQLLLPFPLSDTDKQKMIKLGCTVDHNLHTEKTTVRFLKHRSWFHLVPKFIDLCMFVVLVGIALEGVQIFLT